MHHGLKRGFLTELFFKHNINSESVFEHRDTAAHRSIFIKCLLCLHVYHVQGFVGRVKRLAGRLSVTLWAHRRRLKATAGVGGTVSVLVLTHRNADLGVWHCFGLWSAGR